MAENADELLVRLEAILSEETVNLIDQYVAKLKTIVDTIGQVADKSVSAAAKNRTLKNSIKEVSSREEDRAKSLDDVKDAQDDVTSSSIKWADVLATAKNKILGLVAALSTARFSIQAYANYALGSVKEIQQMADVTGLTTEKIQKLQYAGSRLGVGDSLVEGFAQFSKHALVLGKNADRYLESIFEQAKGWSIGQSRAMADHLQVPEEFIMALRQAAREGKNLNEIMQEAASNGNILSEDEIQASVRFSNEWSTLIKKLEMFGTKIVVSLLPTLQSFQNMITEAAEALRSPEFLEFVEGFMEGFEWSISKVINAGKLLIGWINNVRQRLETMGIKLELGKIAFAAVAAAVGALVLSLAVVYGKIVLIIGAVVALSSVIVGAWNNVDRFGDSFDGLKNTVADTVSEISMQWAALKGAFGWDDEGIDRPGGLNDQLLALKVLFISTVKAIVFIVQWLVSMLSNSFIIITKVFAHVADSITGLITAFQQLTKLDFRGFEKTLSGLSERQKQRAEDILRAIGRIFTSTFKFIANVLHDLIDMYLAPFRDSIDSMKMWMSDFGTACSDVIDLITGKFTKFFDGVGGRMVGFIKDIASVGSGGAFWRLMNEGSKTDNATGKRVPINAGDVGRNLTPDPRPPMTSSSSVYENDYSNRPVNITNNTTVNGVSTPNQAKIAVRNGIKEGMGKSAMTNRYATGR